MVNKRKMSITECAIELGIDPKLSAQPSVNGVGRMTNKEEAMEELNMMDTEPN